MSGLALLCPGQGAQFVGMGKDAAEASPACRALWDAANEAMGRDLAAICFEGPEADLTRSSNTQPGIVVVSVALYSLLRERDPSFNPAAIAGLIGEWTALHLAGVLTFEDTLAKDAGAKMAIPLPVAGAFHSELMRPAAEPFEALLAEIPFSAPAIPVISNVTADFHQGPDRIRAGMVEQITSPVRWYEGIETIRRTGINEFVECGPGKVLSGLVKRIDKEARLHTIHDLHSADSFLSPD